MADSLDTFHCSNIAQFYDGRSIFLTGGTGFIGKVIVEKLLRSCPNINTIYFLVRPKKGKTCEERMDSIFSLPLFKKLNEKDPEARNKVVPIQGDITHKSLGISDEDRQTLVDNVDIIMHSAATVKFNEHIRIAMEMNVIAVIEMIKLAKAMKKLEIFCHVSTAYSQCNQPKSLDILEKFYPVSVEPENIIEAMGWMNDKMLTGFTEPLIDKYPNTYTFTKALAEHLIKKESENIPFMIVRPSIVSSSISDPFPGWVDNYNGVSGMMVAVGRGIVRSLYAPEIKHDIVPVDFVSNCIIVSTWYYGVSRLKTPMICNCTSGNVNPTSFVDMQKVVLPVFSHHYPLTSIFRRPNFAFAPNRFLNQYWQMVSHYIPAIILDGLTVLVGMKPRFMNIYRTIDSSISTLDFFIQNEWKWGHTEFSKILKAVPEDDKEAFDFDMRKIDWSNYYADMTIGVKKFLVKDDMAELPKARNIHRRYKMVRWLSSTIFILLAGRFFFLKSERFRKLWFEALFSIYKFLHLLRIPTFRIV
uniref:Fatty acyl-CoA reductase n=1 Tax=Clytia hemisphaerica TaxID=252671 RepID=A0A7M5UXY2_9CNID